MHTIDPSHESVQPSLKENGFAIIPGAFSPDEIPGIREDVLAQLPLFKKTRASDNARHLASFHRHPALELLHSRISGNAQILEALQPVFGEEIVTIGLSDITINRSQQWHKDLLREKYSSHLEGIDIFDRDALSPIKALLYLQPSSALKVLPGSHLHPSDLKKGDKAMEEEWGNVKELSIQSGDVILIDIRLTHAGSTEADLTDKQLDENAKILVSTVFGKDKSSLSRGMELGNMERLFDWQDRDNIYRVTDDHALEARH
ncbi:phytanoyl-CoA dioxygenase family protein [Verrucomicrobiales bacterium]|nr:phytanoyl-CoA dioxygenase family protein [Verrucomicrobiales bacterium]